jgi:UDP-glucose 6-dehydrogenase
VCSSDQIGPEAYLDASVGFSGGHLERDLDYLQKVARSHQVRLPVINAVIKKNTNRRKIVLGALGDVKGKKICFWGTNYKPGVPPSSCSLPAKLMRDLTKLGATSITYDFGDYFYEIERDIAANCHAIICITPWLELKKLNFKEVAKLMKKPRIFFDARNYFKDLDMSMFKYIGVGR